MLTVFLLLLRALQRHNVYIWNINFAKLRLYIPHWNPVWQSSVCSRRYANTEQRNWDIWKLWLSVSLHNTYMCQRVEATLFNQSHFVTYAGLWHRGKVLKCLDRCVSCKPLTLDRKCQNSLLMIHKWQMPGSLSRQEGAESHQIEQSCPCKKTPSSPLARVWISLCIPPHSCSRPYYRHSRQTRRWLVNLRPTAIINFL